MSAEHHIYPISSTPIALPYIYHLIPLLISIHFLYIM